VLQRKQNQILADFLGQPAEAISCEFLVGGSEEENIAKCTYGRNNYVIKIFGNPELGINEIRWTQHASDLKIGPHVYDLDPDGRYLIMGFALGQSLVPSTANSPAVISGVARSLARLHSSSSSFVQAKHASGLFARVNTKYAKIRCSGELKELLERGMQRVEAIKKRVQNNKILHVPCHNDLNWGNIFIDRGHVSLIDWGDAALGDPGYDIAVFFVLNIIQPHFEELFFKNYAGSSLPGIELQENINLYKQLVHFEFALNLLGGAQAGNSMVLHAASVSGVENINVYLNKLASRSVGINSLFLYETAIASLNKMMEYSL
jgi:tRNA A-37 threonylcarbamoyl transferase component Bud32